MGNVDCCENSTCMDGINNYTCQCLHGMKGIDCCSGISFFKYYSSLKGYCKYISN